MSKYYVLDFVHDNMPSLIESILMITCLLQLYLQQERMSRATLSRTIWKNRITNWVAISGYKRKLDFWIELSRNSLSNESKLGTNEILRISGRIVGLQSNLHELIQWISRKVTRVLSHRTARARAPNSTIAIVNWMDQTTENHRRNLSIRSSRGGDTIWAISEI